MLKYVSTALALKAFSATPATRKLYRSLANAWGGNRRAVRQGRGRWLTDVHKNRVDPGDRVLDLGTGWIHWNALYLRQFYDVRITALDVWDNRQFDAMQRVFSTIERNLVVDTILRSQSFEELYAALDMEYVLDANGSLNSFPADHFQTIFSLHTLEHVPRAVIREQVEGMYRVLKPGGYAIHHIDTGDHLSRYDRKVSNRQFLAWDASWRLLFNNSLQYVNRLLPADYSRLFEEAGFELEHEEVKREPLTVKVAEPFKHYSLEDLECQGLTVIYRKPVELNLEAVA